MIFYDITNSVLKSQGNAGRAALFPSAATKISKSNASPYSSSDSNYSSSFSPRVQRAARMQSNSSEVPKSLSVSQEHL